MSVRPGYRADIDGLRAVAVLSVVAYHAHPGAAPGGFVGVDVFFVISGYLIAQIVQADVAAGRFTLMGFYERRVRRIAPALIAMLVVCTLVFALYFAPFDFKAYAQSVGATLAFASNVYFWLKSGYFDAGAQTKPLLHTWSLAVEEQYYLVFPLLVAALYRRGQGARLLPVLSALAVLSLAVAVVQLPLDPRGAFYLPASRAWELLAGALLACAGLQAPPSAAKRLALSIGSAGLVLAPVVLYDHEIAFPGLAALPPVLGAVGLIWAGSLPSGTPAPLPNRLLASAPLVGIGRVSYSMYLWHWPVVVGAQYLLLRPLRGPWELAVYGAVVALLAWASWRYVEQPFRDGALRAWRRPRLFAAAGVSAALLFGVAVAVHVLQGLPGRIPEPARQYAAAALDVNPRRAACDRPSPERVAAGDLCRLGLDDEGEPDFLLFGDSFADALAPGFDRVARDTGRRGVSLTYSGCVPFPGAPRNVEACERFVEGSLAYLAARPSIRRVVLVARWTSAYHGNRFGPFHADDANVTEGEFTEPGAADNARAFVGGLSQLLGAMQGRELTVIAHIPEHPHDVPRALMLSAMVGRPAQVALPQDVHDARQAPVRAALQALQRAHPYTLLDLGGWLCDGTRCDVQRDGTSLYADDDHLSNAGALALQPAWRQALGLPGLAAARADGPSSAR